MRKHRKLYAVLAAIAAIAFLILAVAPSFVTRADTVSELQGKLEEAQNARRKAENGLKTTQADISDAKAKREALDADISALENEIYALSLQIAENEENIANAQAELDEARRQSDEYTDVFQDRVRVMYERSSVSYLQIIFGATSFSDLLKRIEMVGEIVSYDKAVLAHMAEVQQEIADKKAVLEEENQVVELNRQIQASKKAELDANKQSLNNVISSLQADEASYRAALDEADAAEEALRQEIRNMTASSQTQQSTSSSSSQTQTQTAPAAYSGGRFQWPAPSTTVITSEYGTRYHPIQKRTKMHTGIDIGAGYGASVVAAEAGTVLRAGWNSGYGNYVVIDHGGGVQTLYGHCSALLVSSGQTVSRGETIAKVGSTGNSTGPHLHFEVLINGSYTDPMSYFG